MTTLEHQFDDHPVIGTLAVILAIGLAMLLGVSIAMNRSSTNAIPSIENSAGMTSNLNGQ